MCLSESDEDPNPTLNRLGAIRLLTAIEKQCPCFTLCENWEDCKASVKSMFMRNSHNPTKTSHTHKQYSHNTVSNISHTNTITTRTQTPWFRKTRPSLDSNTHPSTTVGEAHHLKVMKPQSHYDNHKTRIFTPSTNTNSNVNSHSRNHTYANATNIFNSSSHLTRTYPGSTNTQHHSHYSLTNSPINAYSDTQRRKIGCFNCGEFNHRRSTCRFDHKLRCEICHALGHKSRLCSYYSN